jgi:hypothetical protein
LFTWLVALAAFFGVLEVFFDSPVATFIFGTANLRRFIPNQIEADAVAGFNHFACQTFMLAVGTVVDSEEQQFSFSIEPAVSFFRCKVLDGFVIALDLWHNSVLKQLACDDEQVNRILRQNLEWSMNHQLESSSVFIWFRLIERVWIESVEIQIAFESDSILCSFEGIIRFFLIVVIRISRSHHENLRIVKVFGYPTGKLVNNSRLKFETNLPILKEHL